MARSLKFSTDKKGDSARKPAPIRRIAAGHDGDNVAKVIANAPAPTVRERAETLDLMVVAEGEIDMDMDMDMDDSTVRMKAGDTMVQRGTNHAWVNRGAKPAKIAILLVDAEPLGIGHSALRGGVTDDHAAKA